MNEEIWQPNQRMVLLVSTSRFRATHASTQGTHYGSAISQRALMYLWDQNVISSFKRRAEVWRQTVKCEV